MMVLGIRFAWVMLAAAVAVSALAIILFSGFGIFPPPIFVVLPMIIGAFDAGRAAAIRNGRAMSRREAWPATVGCFAVGVGLMLFLFIGVFVAQGAALPNPGDFVLHIAFFVLVMLILLRTSMFLGERTVLNAQN
ncbi:MAG: ABZJ_00895 family protein [Pseudomonadota bacterium]